ncbi:hypothetical protein F66182_14785 [Fusarium sp. NRRL 66182]|nr:hypothetical protein F66182_14785 [Fusarium sp. NRRL 66182]
MTTTVAPPTYADAQAQPVTETTSTNTIEKDLGLPLSAAEGLIKKPFGQPAEGVKIPAAADLTADQTKKYDEVLKTVTAFTAVPTSLAKNASESPLTDDERMWLTRECLLRFLRATKWNVADAIKRIRATLAWRRDYIGDKLTAEKESATGGAFGIYARAGYRSIACWSGDSGAGGEFQ